MTVTHSNFSHVTCMWVCMWLYVVNRSYSLRAGKCSGKIKLWNTVDNLCSSWLMSDGGCDLTACSYD